MTVLIAGCGDLGTEAGLRFAAAGHRVIGWRRSPGLLPDAIEGVSADLAGDLPAIPADTDIVVFAPAAGERTAETYRRVYLEGLTHVLDALERDGISPRRILLVSSTAVNADTDGAWVDESTPVGPSTETAAITYAMEQLLAARAPQGIVLRLSGIYGPGRTWLIDKVRNGSTGDGPPRYTNRIHRDDAAAALVHLATAVADPAPVYLGVDEEPAPSTEVFAHLARQLGVAYEPGPAATEPPTGKRLRGELLRSTGFTFSYPTYREGYAAVLAGEGSRHP